MKEFELKLGANLYKCTSNAYGSGQQNWNINTKFHDLTVNMSIPMESKVSMEKVMIFVTTFDETLKSIQQEKGKGLSFITQLT